MVILRENILRKDYEEENVASFSTAMNSTGYHLNSLETCLRVLSLLFVLTILIMYCVINYRIYMKHKTIMEPIHVFQINFMSLSIWLLCFQCIKIIQDLVNQNESCLFYIFGFFGLTSWNCDIVLMQIDRVLAIYWKLGYKSRVTTKMAIISCISSKFITMISSSIVFIYDTTYTHCSHPLSLFHLKSSNVYMDAYPKLVVADILLVVPIYVKLAMKNL